MSIIDIINGIHIENKSNNFLFSAYHILNTAYVVIKYTIEWKRCYEEERAVEDVLNKKIDQLYKEKEEDRKRIRELLDKNTQLELKNQALEFIKCNNALKCIDRDPPNEFIRKATSDQKERKQ